MAPGQRHAVLAAVDPASAHYALVLAGHPRQLGATHVDARRLVPADAWPFAESGPVRVVLVAEGHTLVLHPEPPTPHSRPA